MPPLPRCVPLMARARKKQVKPEEPTIISTALHIGAGSISAMVCERQENAIIPLDFLAQPAPLAQDIFRSGSVSAATIERIVSIIKGYQKSFAELGLDPHRISRSLATNILSEASNHESVLNRIRVACGLEVSTLDDGEMTRLIYLKTRRRLHDIAAMKDRNTLVVHVGPGNTRALLFQNNSITRYTSYRLGTHRTREAVEGSHADGPALLRVIRKHASGNLAQMKFDYSDVTIDTLVVIGNEVQSVARQLAKPGHACPVKTLRQFVTEAANASDVELVKRFRLDYQTAEALLPALEINLAIAELLNLPQLHIPATDYEQGLLQDILISRDLTGTFADEVLGSAKILAARYHSDPRHGEHVGKLCQRFFNELSDLHKLDEHDALLLQVAAILHEVGTFVSPRAHHKHSEYIILNSEIFGLDRIDVTIVALVSRYHRHSVPKPDHPHYRELSIDNRIRVSKLAALLRVADALERTHDQRVNDIGIRRDGSKLRLTLPGLADAAVERLAMESKGDLFEQVFGLRVTIDAES